MRRNLGGDRGNSLGGDREKKLENALRKILGRAYHGIRAEMPQFDLLEIIQIAEEAL